MYAEEGKNRLLLGVLCRMVGRNEEKDNSSNNNQPKLASEERCWDEKEIETECMCFMCFGLPAQKLAYYYS